jgi:hypothetical protein
MVQMGESNSVRTRQRVHPSPKVPALRSVGPCSGGGIGVRKRSRPESEEARHFGPETENFQLPRESRYHIATKPGTRHAARASNRSSCTRSPVSVHGPAAAAATASSSVIRYPLSIPLPPFNPSLGRQMSQNAEDDRLLPANAQPPRTRPLQPHRSSRPRHGRVPRSVP